MTKHPIKAQQIGLHHCELNLHGSHVFRGPYEVLLISRVHAKLLITLKEVSKGRREQPNFPTVLAANAVIRGIGGRQDLSNQPPRVMLMT